MKFNKMYNRLLLETDKGEEFKEDALGFLAWEKWMKNLGNRPNPKYIRNSGEEEYFKWKENAIQFAYENRYISNEGDHYINKETGEVVTDDDLIFFISRIEEARAESMLWELAKKHGYGDDLSKLYNDITDFQTYN